MNFIKKHKWKIISGAVAVAVLVIAFIIGDRPTASVLPEWQITPTPGAVETSAVTLDEKSTPYPTEEINTPQPTESLSEIKKGDTQTQKPASATKPETKSEPSQTQAPKDDKLTCTLSVRCDTLLNNMSELNPEKKELVPASGVIFPETTVVFYDGESVINVLAREMKKKKIHLEFVNVPMYNSAYIEGIANLYENACGELSGWMYKVNGRFPNYGSSQYYIKPGDKIEWVYTCDLGRDVGGGYSPRNGRQ